MRCLPTLPGAVPAELRNHLLPRTNIVRIKISRNIAGDLSIDRKVGCYYAGAELQSLEYWQAEAFRIRGHKERSGSGDPGREFCIVTFVQFTYVILKVAKIVELLEDPIRLPTALTND